MVAYDPKAVEPAVLAFWERNKIYPKAKAQVKGAKPFYFLDGPPYTNGKVHLGTSLNKAMKDMVLRQKRMAGIDVWDRAGYDMHGLPTENVVRRKFNVSLAKDIERFGVAKFTDECEKFSVEMMHVMTQTFRRLGVWMDFDNAYLPITREFISGEWFLAKKAHEQGRLYEGLRTMPWCATCQTNLAKHELEYATVTDNSVFVKLPVKDKKNEFLIIWTTTPWTIPLNLAVMVNPDLDYVRARVDGEVWIMAKALAGTLVAAVAEKQLSILEEFKGAKLEGLDYTHPFADIIEFKDIKKSAPKTHTVLLSAEYVDTSAGSGLVHCAPGCGPEDYEVGHRNGLPAWNVVDAQGRFPADWKEFGGLTAKKDDATFVEALQKRGALIASTKVEHEYGHCQRCHEPIIFRTTKQWFFKVEDLKDKMVEANKRIAWVPEAAFNAFDSWLKNLRDNSITKQNFWGTPVPIWRCGKCHQYDVFGSVDELEAKTKKKVAKLHKPWIDDITYHCTCGSMRKRIPDIFDVWVDAGTASWICLDYPQREDLLKRLFPADFILEGKDQIRGWFNLLMVASMLAFGKPSFRAVYMHGFIQDALGRKMSKSLGNYIEPSEVVDQYGADTLRYYQIGASLPGLDQNYNGEDVKLTYKNLLVLWNVHNYLLDFTDVLKNEGAFKPVLGELDTPEKYILSKLQTTIKDVTHAFDQYHLNEVPWLVEDLYLELSRTYIQLVRDKASASSDDDKRMVAGVINRVLTDTLALLAPIAPFIAEQMYQDLREKLGLKVESVHLLPWPAHDPTLIDVALERNFRIAGSVMQAALFGREKLRFGVRWPVKGIVVVTTGKDVKDAVHALADVVKTQVNVKEIKVQESLPEVKEELHVNAAVIGKQFKQQAPAILQALQKQNLAEVNNQLKARNTYEIKTPAGMFALTSEHFTATRSVPAHLIEVPFSGGIVYLDKEPSDALEAEGFSREVGRRVQEARKKAGLEKKDAIDLHIEAQPTLIEMLKPWVDAMKQKVNAREIHLDMLPPSRKHQHRTTEQIKHEIFSLHFDRAAPSS